MNSCVALREAYSHAQGIPFDALSKLEPEEGVEPSPPLYQSGVLPLSLRWHTYFFFFFCMAVVLAKYSAVKHGE